MFPSPDNTEEQQLDFLDMITVYSAILQTLDYEATMSMTSNDDIIKEMHRQNSAYLNKIIEQNEKIIGLLESNPR